MAFLDNSGDVILDAVLTDTGRKRLAAGDGSFKVVKFALGDDEIDYSQYQNSNNTAGANSSGSAYYDVNILQTPIFEAFTNNASVLKSRLISIPDNTLRYLPTLKQCQNTSNTSAIQASDCVNLSSKSVIFVSVDANTEGGVQGNASKINLTSSNSVFYNSTLQGFNPAGGQKIRVDHGLDTNALSFVSSLTSDLTEQSYIIEIDNRLGQICDQNGVIQTPSYIDDDNIASYYFNVNTDPNLFQTIGTDSNGSNTSVITGPHSTNALKFKIKASLDLQTSNYLFNLLGSAPTGTFYNPSDTSNTSAGSTYLYDIDTFVRITGVNTGTSLDLPVRFVKWY